MSDSLRWLVVQLHPFAIKKKRSREIINEIRRRFRDDTLQVFYGVAEDESNKYSSPWDEYCFVEYRDQMVIHELKDEEFFVGVLRSVGGLPQIVEDHELDSIRSSLMAAPKVNVGDWVRVIEGSHEGYEGHVIDYVPSDIAGQAQVVLVLRTGESTEEVCVPCRWVRRKRSRRKSL